MESPLKYDSEIQKEFGLTDVHELDSTFKLNYARTQLEEIKKFLWRERVELMLAEAQTKTEVEAIAAEARTKVASHRNNIKGIKASIEVLDKLVHEFQHTPAV